MHDGITLTFHIAVLASGKTLHIKELHKQCTNTFNMLRHFIIIVIIKLHKHSKLFAYSFQKRLLPAFCHLQKSSVRPFIIRHVFSVYKKTQLYCLLDKTCIGKCRRCIVLTPYTSSIIVLTILRYLYCCLCHLWIPKFIRIVLRKLLPCLCEYAFIILKKLTVYSCSCTFL